VIPERIIFVSRGITVLHTAGVWISLQTAKISPAVTLTKCDAVCHSAVCSIRTNNLSNFQSNTAVYLLWLSYMSRSQFGTSSSSSSLPGYCITLLKTNVKACTKIYTSVCESPQSQIYTSVCESPQSQIYTSVCESPQSQIYTSVCESPQSQIYTSVCESPQSQTYTSVCESPQSQIYTSSVRAHSHKYTLRLWEPTVTNIHFVCESPQSQIIPPDITAIATVCYVRRSVTKIKLLYRKLQFTEIPLFYRSSGLLTHWGWAGSFKLFKRPFPGFLTILTL